MNSCIFIFVFQSSNHLSNTSDVNGFKMINPKDPKDRKWRTQSLVFLVTSDKFVSSPLRLCTHLTHPLLDIQFYNVMTDTSIKRTAAKSPAKTNYRRLTEINTCYYGLSLIRTLPRGPYSVRYKGS